VNNKHHPRPVIIVGAMKAGTTSLRYFLTAHPKINFGCREVHYFNSTRSISQEGYEKAIRRSGCDFSGDYFGDDTPAYSYDESCAQKILDLYPEAKILFLLRDPVKRAESNYWHAVRRGVESRSLEMALKQELSGDTKNRWLTYIERSRYSAQIERFARLMPSTNLMVLSLDQLIAAPVEEAQKICNFLGVQHDPKLNAFPLQNAMNTYPDPSLNKILGERWNRTRATKYLALKLREISSFRSKKTPMPVSCIELLTENLSYELELWRSVCDGNFDLNSFMEACVMEKVDR